LFDFASGIKQGFFIGEKMDVRKEIEVRRKRLVELYFSHGNMQNNSSDLTKIPAINAEKTKLAKEIQELESHIYSQINIIFTSPTLSIVKLSQNNRAAGNIDSEKRIFYSTPFYSKNLMYLYPGDSGGLGICEEILSLDSFDLIKLNYRGDILTTTRTKWLAKGFLSPLDRQIVLKLDQINMEGVE
jgi:hypothetical protein